MKTNEFKNLLCMYGLEVAEETGIVFVLKQGITAATVSPTHVDCYGTQFQAMMDYCIPERKEIVAIIKEYAETDVEDRKDEKLARLRLDVPLVELPYYLYRNVHTGLKGITIIQNNEQCSDYQMEFTADELLGLNRTGFKVEVVG